MIVDAIYTPQDMPTAPRNLMIEALPRRPSDKEIFQSLVKRPDFDPCQRDWPDDLRLLQVESLANFMSPQSRHLEFVRRIDCIIREGYKGRQPEHHSHVISMQELYAANKAGGVFSQRDIVKPTSTCATLLGVSGMGKSVTVKRWFGTYPRAIRHEHYDHPQIPYVHVDMSSAGNNVKALASAIIREISAILPEYDYEATYILGTRASTENLLQAAGRLLAIHYVGILVVDEVQNLGRILKRSKTATRPGTLIRGAERIMAELTTLCNITSVPILFIGTPQAVQILSRDFRIARRALGFGISEWHRLPLYDDPSTKESEWIDFIEELATYQWVKQPLELTEELIHTIYEYTQGIIALAIKLFAMAQIRAIIRGTDAISPALIDQVYVEDFKLVRPMIEALSNNDMKALELFDDVAGMDQHLQHLIPQTVSIPRSKRSAPRTDKSPSPRKAKEESRPPPGAPEEFPLKPRPTPYLDAYNEAVAKRALVIEVFSSRGLIVPAETLISLD